jgi:hypothetical protein
MEVFMRVHLKQYTEPIFATLADYRARLIEHPFLVALDHPAYLLHEFAFYQYADSILWIPMLAQMRGKAPWGVLEASARLWISDAFAAMTEPEVAGFLLAAETLVPVMAEA